MAVIQGTDQRDVLFGTTSNDTITPYAQNDYVSADAGHDIIYGAGDFVADAMFGGTGNDTIYGDFTNWDLAVGDEGDDFISALLMSGRGGNDIFMLSTSSSVIQYSGNISDYRVSSAFSAEHGNHYTVTDIRQGSPDGTDIIKGADGIWAGNENFMLTFNDSSSSAPNPAVVNVWQTERVHRFYNTATETHFYTSNLQEVQTIQATLPSFRYEGAAFSIPRDTSAGNAAPMHRFYNTATESHFYTFNNTEVSWINANLPTFRYEGTAMYGYTENPVNGSQELYRFYNLATETHFFTASETERDFVLGNLPSYRFEGVAGYVFA